MQKFLFGALADKKRSAKIAYVAIFVALNIVVNAVTSIPLGIVQFSFTILVTSLTGIILGPFFGFCRRVFRGYAWLLHRRRSR